MGRHRATLWTSSSAEIFTKRIARRRASSFFLAAGESIDDIVRKFPQLSREAVAEAVRLASDALHDRYQDDLLAARDLARRCRDTAVEAQAGVAGV